MTEDTLRRTAPGRRRMSRRERENQLLDIAEELFVERGYADTSIEDIARAAGVTRPVVYEHHGNKEGIYLACVRRARRRFEDAVQAAYRSTDDPREQLARGADAYFQVLEKDPRRWELLFGPSGLAADTLARELNNERNRTVALVAELCQVHVPDADPMHVLAVAHAQSGCAEQLGRWWLTHRDVPRSTVVQYHVDLLWPGLQQLMHRYNPA
ncbi:MAG TPA: TetR/AcrR family transcriptional regulator [Thermomonospora sp.]|nr:TetR/AcrR family transcriptional regulator [Thermomonospora sp.]